MSNFLTAKRNGVPKRYHAEDAAEFDALPDQEKDQWLEVSGWNPSQAPKPRKTASTPVAASNDNAVAATSATVIPFGSAKPRANDTVLEALKYARSGLHVIAVERQGRKPINDNWNKVALTEEDIQRIFDVPEPPNVGIVTGENSKGVCDVDCDWPLAGEVAAGIIGLDSFGRPGKPMSHYLFMVPAGKPVEGVVEFVLPDAPQIRGKLPDAHALCVLEVRGNGHMTVFPPSIHKSGEPVSWTSPYGFEMPPQREWQNIVQLAGVTAFLTVMIAWYPPEGHRNDFSLGLGAALLRALGKDYPDDDDGLIASVDNLVQMVCKAAGDQGRGRSWTERARKTLERMRGGLTYKGLHNLCEIIGCGPEVEHRFRQWLGIEEADDRPIIVYSEGDLEPMLQRAQAAMLDTGVPIYQRGGVLVKPMRLASLEAKDGISRPAGSLIIAAVKPTEMRVHMTTAAAWKMPAGGRGNKTKWGAPPTEFAKTMLDYRDEWTFKPLTGIVEIPTMRADGSVIASEGYDKDTGLLVDFGGVEYPEIPERPTWDESLAGLAKLKWLIKDFPFVNDGGDDSSASRSVALSLILTPLVRHLVPTAPLHLIDATTPGEGKTLLFDVAALVATGRPATITTFTSNSEEMEKRIVSLLMRGDSVINFDNASVALCGDMLDALLTKEAISPRQLGGNQAPPLPNNATWGGTGNNIKVKGDTPRRTIKSRLNSGHPYPEQRQTHEIEDLRAHLLEHRAELVAAGLTFLRGYIVSGANVPKALVLGSFEGWSKYVRAPLVWAGEPDPVLTQNEIRDNDPVRAGQTMLLSAWRDCEALPLGEWFRAEQIIAQSSSNSALATALASLCPMAVNARAVGTALSAMRDRLLGLPRADGTEDLYKIESHSKHGYAHYRLTHKPQQAELALGGLEG